MSVMTSKQEAVPHCDAGLNHCQSRTLMDVPTQCPVQLKAHQGCLASLGTMHPPRPPLPAAHLSLVMWSLLSKCADAPRSFSHCSIVERKKRLVVWLWLLLGFRSAGSNKCPACPCAVLARPCAVPARRMYPVLRIPTVRNASRRAATGEPPALSLPLP